MAGVLIIEDELDNCSRVLSVVWLVVQLIGIDGSDLTESAWWPIDDGVLCWADNAAGGPPG